MSCGKKRARKLWDHSRQIPVVHSSKYEKNETSVKKHWQSVLTELESSYKDEKFWETTGDQVHELVGDVIFKRIEKIFNLPPKPPEYVFIDGDEFKEPSENFYVPKERGVVGDLRKSFSISDIDDYEEEGEEEILEEEEWSLSTEKDDDSNKLQRSKSGIKSTRSISRVTRSSKLFGRSSKTLPKLGSKSFSTKSKSKTSSSFFMEAAYTEDDLHVHAGDFVDSRKRRRQSSKITKNPFYEMLYCAASETDMIKWKSKYKQKKYEISASDEFSMKAEIRTKEISNEFFDWWSNLGSNDYRSEIKRPEDIEALFQVWFDEHASRGLVLDPKIIPCVLKNIADYANVPKNACVNVLQKQIEKDIIAETSPAHTIAFNTCLPHRMKHIPPRNNTKEIWHSLIIPEDLKSMACVWDDIKHLTSTKSFQAWLNKRPFMPMPPVLRSEGNVQKKSLFVIPSDYVLVQSSEAELDLTIPFSQVNVEMKDVLNKLMNQ